MKSCATMLRVAKARAGELGARVWKGTRCGFHLTIGELGEIYTGEGFNRRGTAMRRHLMQWMAIDEAVVEGSLFAADSAVWFACPEEERTLVMVRSEQCGGRCVTDIRREDWPALRRMHGLDREALA